MTTKPTEVVVAVAFDKDGRFLMTSRPEGLCGLLGISGRQSRSRRNS